MARFVLFDTDVLIDTGRRVPEALERLRVVEQEATPAVSVVTEMELLVGCRDRGEQRNLAQFLGQFAIWPIDHHISGQAVDLLRRYRLSHGLLIADALIAATALAHGVSLISKNQRDFRFIEALSLPPYP